MCNQLLRKSDWAGMAHCQENRVLDLEYRGMLRQVASLLAMRERLTKLEMARAPHRSGPDVALSRGKSGFFLPVLQWLAEAEGHKALPQIRGLQGWPRLVYCQHTGAS